MRVSDGRPGSLRRGVRGSGVLGGLIGSVLGTAGLTLFGCSPLNPGNSTRNPLNGMTGAPVDGQSPIGGMTFNESFMARVLAGPPGLTREAPLGTPPHPPPDFEAPRSILRAVLAAAPNPATVYPSERYYYYVFPLGPRQVSGNIRFAEAGRGRISVGYFDARFTGDSRTAEFVDGQDGVRVRFDPATFSVDLAVDGIERRFRLDRSALRPPSFPLLEGERHVSGVLDESGYALHLLYWKPGRCFYYVLNEDFPRPEAWSRGLSTRVEVWWGDRSGFCFLRHPSTGRYILVGVHQHEVRMNTWFDGPFDQVPPDLPLRPMLEHVYPYILDAGGVDEHGNFLRTPGSRVAISPYQEYVSGPAFEAWLEQVVTDAPTPEAWVRATHEWKSDWRPSQERGAAGASPLGNDEAPRLHERRWSVTWPLHHWTPDSRQWGTDHDQPTSLSWPPRHAVETSRR